MDLLTTCIHHSELHFTDHWHTQTTILNLLQSPLAVSWQRLLPVVLLQLPALRSSLSQLPGQNSCQLTAQLTSSQAGGHFTPTSYLLFMGLLSLKTGNWALSPTYQLLHVTSLNWTPDNWLQLGWCPWYITLGRTQQETPPPTILLFLPWAVA
jgi:hypothetical protein